MARRTTKDEEDPERGAAKTDYEGNDREDLFGFQITGKDITHFPKIY